MPKKNKNHKVKIIAVIDIGSGGIRLKIAQDNKKSYKILDYLVYPINLGRDVYEKQKISFEKVDQACVAIKNFLQVIKEYETDEVLAVATTCIREAQNKDYILDQIKIKTGLTIRVLDDYEEKRYITRIMYAITPKNYLKSAFMVYMGSGNIGILLIKDKQITHMQNIKVGSVRINELFDNISDYAKEFHLVVEQYLDTMTKFVNIGEKQDIKYLITSGHDISVIASLCDATQDDQFLFISKKRFLQLYDEIKFKSVDKIVFDYNISFEQAELLFSSMCIYHNLIKFIHEDTIVVPMVFLSDALILESLDPKLFKSYSEQFNQNTIVQVKAIAKSFKSLEAHINLVEQFSLLIFDKLKKLHGLGQRERMLLQISAILHHIGQFINMKTHYVHTYNMIKGLDIIGLDCLETEVTALICLYHSDIVPSTEDLHFCALDSKDRVVVSKLSAILRLADALDRSSKQKFETIDVNFSDSNLIISVKTDSNIELEQWAFSEKSEFFEEVFGIKAILKKKRVI